MVIFKLKSISSYTINMHVYLIEAGQFNDQKLLTK